jgi:hypothetical protein
VIENFRMSEEYLVRIKRHLLRNLDEYTDRWIFYGFIDTTSCMGHHIANFKVSFGGGKMRRQNGCGGVDYNCLDRRAFNPKSDIF